MMAEGCSGSVWRMFRDMIAVDFNVPVPTTDVEDEALMLLMWENMKTHSNVVGFRG